MSPTQIERADGTPGSLEHSDVRRLLPHAHPICLVDRVVAWVPDQYAIAHKAISGAEPCYAGLTGAGGESFAYPRSLVLESFCQTGALLWLAGAELAGHRPDGDLVFAVGRDIRFTGDVHPGDVLRLEVRVQNRRGDTVFFTGSAHRGGPAGSDADCVLRVGSIVTSVIPPAPESVQTNR